MKKNQEDPNKKNFWLNKVFKAAVETTLQYLKSRIGISEERMALISKNLPCTLTATDEDIIEISKMYGAILPSETPQNSITQAIKRLKKMNLDQCSLIDLVKKTEPIFQI